MKQIEILQKMSKGAILSEHLPYYNDPAFLHLYDEDNEDVDYDLRMSQLRSLLSKRFIRYFRSMNLWNNQYRITNTGLEYLKMKGFEV